MDHTATTLRVHWRLNFDNVVRYSALKNSRPEVFCKKVFLEVAQNSQENTCDGASFFNKVEGLTPATLLKKRLWHKCFPVNFAKFIRIPFLTQHLGLWLSKYSKTNRKLYFWEKIMHDFYKNFVFLSKNLFFSNEVIYLK